jgi:hypothetical protein
MALTLGDLVQAAGGFFGGREAGGAQLETDRERTRLLQELKAQADAGQVTGFGDVLSRRDPETGASTTTFSPLMQALANRQLANTQGTADVDQARIGETARRLGTLDEGRLSREQAGIEVDKDINNLIKSSIDPLYESAALTDVRAGRPFTSNVGSPSSALGKTAKQVAGLASLDRPERVESLLAQNLGGIDTRALALNPSGAGNIQLPGVQPATQSLAAGANLASSFRPDPRAGLPGETAALLGAASNRNDAQNRLIAAIGNSKPGLTGGTFGGLFG